MIEIPGDTLEGGGQIVRTAVALSCITRKPIRIYKIRANRPNPGIKPQLYYTLKALVDTVHARAEGLEMDSTEIRFFPSPHAFEAGRVTVDLKTSGAIGLALQVLLPIAVFKSGGISFRIKGGTCGLGAVPVDYYPEVVFPVLRRSGVRASLEIVKRGYYPKGGGEVAVTVAPLVAPVPLEFLCQGKLISIHGKSIASGTLVARDVSRRQAKKAGETLRKAFNVPVHIQEEYTDSLSPGSEINLMAHTDTGCILWSDARGEKGKSAEEVGREAAEKLVAEIASEAAADFHLADNLIPWLSLLGGRIRTSRISPHTHTNIWVCELFFGKIFKILDTNISCSPGTSFP
jgi:RNA 3'-terminal phosphate cyclase (GTP)